MAPNGNPSRIGVDIGGTFTDLVWVDETTGAVRVGKLLTTPKDPSQAVEEGVVTLLHEAGAGAAAVRALIHGTTLATNALIERKGARVGLLATAGFRDAVEIGREGRYDMYDLFIDQPVPLVPRQLRVEVTERVLADGSVLRPLDPVQARAAIAELGTLGVEAIAICLLHAYRNPVHERALAALCAEILPGVPVSCSSDVVPEIREYERTSTTTANVYVMPLMARYLDDLERKLQELGVPGRLYVMMSAGGIATPETAKRVPIRLVESGPAAGALAAARSARQVGLDRLLSFDMGGTTAKACVIDRGGRRLGGAGGSHGPPEGRPGQRGRRSGPRLLRSGRAGADGHRRRSPPRLPRRRLLPGRPDAARRGGGPPGDRDARGATDGPGRHRGRLGHPPGGQREHGGRRARARDRAWQGPARLPALRLRRRGAGACLAGR